MDRERLVLTSADGSHPGQKILHLDGVLTIQTIVEFQDSLRRDEPPQLILDFENVRYMDSSGLGSLIGLYTSFERKGRKLFFVAMSDRVWTLFQVCKIDTLFKRYPTLANAQEAAS